MSFSTDKAVAASESRELLCQIIAEGQPLHDLLQRSDMEALRDRLTELTVPPPEDIATNAEAAAIESSRGRVRTRLLEAWTDPDVVCRNGLIADGNRVICGVTGSNAVIYSLGPGAGSILYCIVCVCINRVGCVYSYCVP